MFTPNHVVAAARVGAGVLGLGLLFLFFGVIRVDLMGFAAACFAFAALLLVAVPRRRSTDVLSAAAIGFALAEFGALLTQRGDGLHLLASLAALLALFVPLKLQRLRSMASRDGYMSFSEWRRIDRRNRFNRAMEMQSARLNRR